MLEKYEGEKDLKKDKICEKIKIIEIKKYIKIEDDTFVQRENLIEKLDFEIKI